jgi:hypothetical protein
MREREGQEDQAEAEAEAEAEAARSMLQSGQQVGATTAAALDRAGKNQKK